jgi:hypothetical protein
MNVTPEEAASSVKMAIDAGVNYFDVSPSYGDAEIKLGQALEPFRKDVFLACKTDGRKRDDSRKEGTDEEDILTGLRFTLSHPIAAAIPPGEPELFKIALNLRDRIKPLKNEEIEIIREKALKGNPIFKFPSR